MHRLGMHTCIHTCVYIYQRVYVREHACVHDVRMLSTLVFTAAANTSASPHRPHKRILRLSHYYYNFVDDAM